MKTAMDIPIADQREYLPPTHYRKEAKKQTILIW